MWAPQDHAARCGECGGALARSADEWACTRCGLVAEEAPNDVVPAPDPTRATPTLAIPRRIVRPGPREARSLYRARSALNRLTDATGLPDHVAQAAFLRYRRLLRAGATGGRRREAVLGACLLEAARDRGLPRTLRDIADAAGVTAREVARAQRALATQARARVLPTPATHYLWPLASRADLPALAVTEAAAVLRGTRSVWMAGRRPEPLAAAALALGCRKLAIRHSVSDLAKHAGVSRQAIYDAMHALEGPPAVKSHE